MTARPSRLPARRILLAEDDDSMRAFIERALVKAGYEVESFGNGRDAHDRLKSGRLKSGRLKSDSLKGDGAGSDQLAHGGPEDGGRGQEPFTLLLTDIVMPQMDGIELARRAADLDPDLKIMFITGFAAVTLNTDAKAVKDAQVLSKPFHLKDLVREIDRLLE
jgi:two-component system, cell cycle response regulator CpdR